MNAMAQLRSATWPSHQRLEKRIDFAARIASRAAYRAHLGQLWGFHAALEPRIARCLAAPLLDDLDERRKLPMLERDLVALGMPMAEVAALPLCPGAPECDEGASAFGCAYVLEGATLGGRTLLPALRARLGLAEGGGADYLASYGDAVDARWDRFGAALERCCRGPHELARAAHAASATFAALEHWLCGPPA